MKSRSDLIKALDKLTAQDAADRADFLAKFAQDPFNAIRWGGPSVAISAKAAEYAISCRAQLDETDDAGYPAFHARMVEWFANRVMTENTRIQHPHEEHEQLACKAVWRAFTRMF